MHSWVFRHHRRLEAIYLRAAPGDVRALPQPEEPVRGEGLRVLVIVPQRQLHPTGR